MGLQRLITLLKIIKENGPCMNQLSVGLELREPVQEERPK
jgi:hypothetical protein